MITSALRRQMREAHPSGLKGAQLLALMRLSRDGPTTVTDLAHAEGIRPQSMGFNITVLEEANLVSRAQDPSDRRRTIISLTDAAQDLIRRSRVGREDWLAHAIEDHLSKQEQKKLQACLPLLRRLIENMRD